MKKTVYICLLLLVLSCTSREKPYSCKLVELQDLNTFPAIDLTPTSIALTDTTLLNPEKIWISDTLLIIKDAETDENKFLKYYSLNSFHLLKMHIPVDTRSAFPVISVQSPVSIQYRWQS